MSIHIFLRTGNKNSCVTVSNLCLLSLLACLAVPADAQSTAYNIANVPGTGKDIAHASLPDVLGSVRLSSGGSNPLGGVSPHRGWFGIEAPTSFTITTGQVTITWSQYLVGIVSNSSGGTVGTTFNLTPTTLEVADFSFGVFNSSTNMLTPAFPGLQSEPHFTSSALSITKSNDFIWATEAFSNTVVPFHRYEFSATYNNLQQFDAKWVGVTYGAAINGSAQRVYAATFTGATGRYSEKIGLTQPRIETVLANGPALGVTIETAGAGNSVVPEPSSAYLLLFTSVSASMVRKRRRTKYVA